MYANRFNNRIFKGNNFQTKPSTIRSEIATLVISQGEMHNQWKDWKFSIFYLKNSINFVEKNAEQISALFRTTVLKPGKVKLFSVT